MKQTRIILLGLAVALAGCSNVADTLGVGRNPPDEFAVVDRPPLTIPPDFELRPPRPGAPRPQEVSMSQKASTTLFGNSRSAFMSARTNSEASDAERSILTAAGSAKAEPNIREVLDRETTQKVVGSKTMIDDILWWRDPANQGATVDAKAEAERIREAKEKGEPVNKSATPIIEKSKSSWLGL